VGATQQPVTSASTWQPVVTQHQQTLQFCIGIVTILILKNLSWY